MNESSIYSAQVREHLSHPRNRGAISNASGMGQDENPVCGDVMTVWVVVEDGTIRRTGFEVQGCAPSTAAGSVMTELMQGRTIGEVQALEASEVEEALGGLPPVKRHCALLASRAAKNAVLDYQSRGEAESRGIRPVVLVVMDGYGCNDNPVGNAVAQANTPVLDALVASNPHGLLAASGLSVGLPEGQMGNSEVGHLNLGAGKVVYQDFTRISQAIDDGSFFRNPALLDACRHAKERDSTLHIMGLIGYGGVHAHQSHLYATLDLAVREGVPSVAVHAFTDGRDTLPNDGLQAMKDLEEKLQAFGVGSVASVSGRYYAMDRDKRWDRTAKAYFALTHREGAEAESAIQAIEDSYARGVTDEFILPTVIKADGKPAVTVRNGDAAIFFNFRTDRPRQLVRAFVDPDFDGFARGPLTRDLDFVTMTDYQKGLPVEVAFESEDVEMPLARVVSEAGLSQLHAAETEKYAHVTFFFNGGQEIPFPGEDRIVVPSRRDVGTYDKVPEMSADAIASQVIEALHEKRYAFVLVNFANADMVGHTGSMDAAVRAVEAVDRNVGRLVDAIVPAGGVLLVTADHGNAEQMVDYGSGGPFTSHTICFPVPFVLVTGEHRDLKGCSIRTGGVLADVAPTVLNLLDIPKPGEMEGMNLLLC